MYVLRTYACVCIRSPELPSLNRYQGWGMIVRVDPLSSRPHFTLIFTSTTTYIAGVQPSTSLSVPLYSVRMYKAIAF